MAFVKEQLNNDQALVWLKKLAPVRPLSSLTSQVIDHETGVVYLELGGRGYLHSTEEPPDGHALLWKEAFVFFSSYETSAPESKMIIRSWTVPEELRDETEAIRSAFEAAVIVSRPYMATRAVFDFAEPHYVKGTK